MKSDFRKILQQGVLVGDGAIGTYLYQQGFPVGISYEELNIEQPKVVEDIHRQYVRAGAQLLETNTFSANREKLSKFGLEDQVEAINRAGVKLARQSAGDSAFVVGAIGSIRSGKRKNVRTSQIESALQEQIHILLDEGVDGMMLETFYDMEELQLALRIIRKISALPVICQFANEGNLTTIDGVTLQDAFDRLAADGADAIGFNCRSGPNGILRMMEKIVPPSGVPFSVFPNAGLPDYVDGRITYAAGPDYFGECARRFVDRGARIVGGCCGTTPEHIAAIASALKNYTPIDQQNIGKHQQTGIAVSIPVTIAPAADATDGSAGEPSILDLVKERHTVIVELDPPRDLDIEKFMRGSKALLDAKVDAITMADNSLAVTRMSNLALGYLIKEQLGGRPLVHIACRDRNMIGTQSHMMGLHALGIDHVLAVTGDPAKFGDLPGSSSVYDLTSFEMIRMIKQLNEGIAFSGKALKKKASFIVGAAFNPNLKYLDKAIQRLERKVEAGADYIMTQPVYDAGLIERIYESTKHIKVPIFIGIMPLANGRNAEYLHNEVPGIQLSEDVRKRMAGLEGEEGRRVGLDIARELLDAAMRYFNGIYLITPFLNYEMSVQLTHYVWERAAAANK